MSRERPSPAQAGDFFQLVPPRLKIKLTAIPDVLSPLNQNRWAWRTRECHVLMGALPSDLSLERYVVVLHTLLFESRILLKSKT